MVVGFLAPFKDLCYLSLDKKYCLKVQDLIVTITKKATKLEILCLKSVLPHSFQDEESLLHDLRISNVQFTTKVFAEHSLQFLNN